LKEKCVLKLQVERNLEGDVSHSSPDFAIMGMLSSVECSIDLAQYKLIRGILDHNLGEPLEEFFSKTLMSHLQDPKIHVSFKSVFHIVYCMLEPINWRHSSYTLVYRSVLLPRLTAEDTVEELGTRAYGALFCNWK
jgi:hypothetical protein